MRYLDVCAGISASSVAWKPLGWEAAAYSGIEAAPRAVLEHRQGALPVGWDHRHVAGSNTTPLFGDFTQIEAHHVGPIDLLVGGTPCQDFSVAGLRAGLDGDRGNLSLEFLRLADRTRPRWVVWENVPGVLSINGGRAFGAILGGLGELGYGFAYRVLDAQHFGVPQRRRRVFVVGYLGDHRRAAAVLFERDSMSGHPAPRRRSIEDITGTLAGGSRRRGGYSSDDIPAVAAYGGNDTRGPIEVSTALNSHGGPHGRLDFESETFIAQPLPFDTKQITSATNRTSPQRGDPCHPLARGAHPPAIAFTSKDHGQDAGALSPTLRAMQGHHANAGGQVAVAYGISSDAIDRTGEGDGSAAQRAGLGIVTDASPTIRARGRDAVAISFQERGREGGRSLEIGGEVAFALTAPSGGGRGQERNIAAGSAVRRLTPRECERLQGFPDDYTLVASRGKPMADGPRYKCLGNSMAVPVMAWIGQRIAAVDALVVDLQAA